MFQQKYQPGHAEQYITWALKNAFQGSKYSKRNEINFENKLQLKLYKWCSLRCILFLMNN